MANNNTVLWNKIYQENASYLYCPDEAFIKLFFRNVSKEQREKAALDFGAGSGPVAEFLERQGVSTTCVEQSAAARHLLSKRLGEQTRVISAMSELNAPDRSYGLVVAWHVLYYLSEQELRQTLDQFKRILSPGGVLICTMLCNDDVFLSQSQNVSPNEYELEFDSQVGIKVLGEDLSVFYEVWTTECVSVGHSLFEHNGVRNHYQLIVVHNA